MRRAVLFAVLLLICPFTVAALAATSVKDAVAQAERAMYAGQFTEAQATLRKALASAPSVSEKADLLLQQLRVQQAARLSGLPDAQEDATLAALSAIAARADAGADLQARIRFATTVSEYFKRLTGPSLGDLRPLQAAFADTAPKLTHPCRRADAMFFTALIFQMQDRVAESAPGLRQARQLAEANHCDLELSYDLRHLAEVAELEHDLPGARRLAGESLAIRQRIGFQVYVP
ncbi:hypothetical protein [Dyella sp.]|uniref:hypothetical protein n=1 Tax=Dyella sp. TaxID=1869338 RepID=UPI002D778452|nr:hypothetical protein [Dyella sp.]HET7332616.1 hypothetical protein [Dyella sp.]